MSVPIARLTGALERELAWSRLVLVELLTALSSSAAARDARRRARERFDGFDLPAAVVGPRCVRLANAAWKTTIGAAVPGWAAVRLDVVRRTGKPIQVEGVRSEKGEFLGASFCTSPALEPNGVLVICAPMRAFAQDHVLAAVTHELRALAATIMLWSRVLRESEPDEATRRQAIEAIHQSASAQVRIVGDLLDVSRAATGKLRVDMAMLDIGELVSNALDAASLSARAKRITLVRDGKLHSVPIRGDAVRLRQVLDNLLCNAINFTPSGGRVCIRVRRKRFVVAVEVVDTGCGIEPDDLEAIFEPFRQLAGCRASALGGLGLGLSIAREIVELHHGTLEAVSEGRDFGTRMILSLPAPRRSHAAHDKIT